MASTIQVDNIKDIGGNTMISSNGSGTFTNNLPANLTGATGTLAIANGGTGNALGGGKILQAVSQTHTSATHTSSTSYVDTGMTVAITPSATSSKIFVIANVLGISSEAGTDSAVSMQVLRDSTKVAETINVGLGDTAQENQGITLQALDSPSSTSALTYKVQFKNRVAASVSINTSTDYSTITAFEVAG